MRGNSHVRFLGGWKVATPSGYPVGEVMCQKWQARAGKTRTFAGTLILDSRVLCDQQLNERTKQRFALLSDIVNTLEKTEVKREFLALRHH
jgi:hypothetical protein